jgi:hypothetical protein
MSKHGTLLASLTAQMEIIEIGTGPDSPISLFPKEITVHSGIVWRDKIYGDRRQICERKKYLLSNINFLDDQK